MKQEDINMLHNAKHNGKQFGNPSTRSNEHIAPVVFIHELHLLYKHCNHELIAKLTLCGIDAYTH